MNRGYSTLQEVVDELNNIISNKSLPENSRRLIAQAIGLMNLRGKFTATQTNQPTQAEIDAFEAQVLGVDKERPKVQSINDT